MKLTKADMAAARTDLKAARITPRARLPRPAPAHRARSGSPEEFMGARIKELRLLKEWSQAELANRVVVQLPGWTQSTVAKTEAATRPIRFNEAVALAEALEVPIGDLVDLGEPVAVMQARMDLQRLMLEYASLNARHNDLRRESEFLSNAADEVEEQLLEVKEQYQVALASFISADQQT